MNGSAFGDATHENSSRSLGGSRSDAVNPYHTVERKRLSMHASHVYHKHGNDCQSAYPCCRP